jgi:DnaJ-class molecular chaperone
MAKKLNYYEILEVYPAATQEEIENSFRMMLYKYHPDHNPDRPDWSHEKTAEVVEAYKILSDPLRRKIYNFMVFAAIKTTLAERKFNLFQGADKKKYEDAAKYFKEGVDFYDTSKANAILKFQQSFGAYRMAEAVYNMGVIYTATNKIQEAMHAFGEAARLEPESQHYARTLEKFKELFRELERVRKLSD